MASHLELGKKGENIAFDFLLTLGYTILETNWKSGKAEIDIIAKNNGILVFIEVKTRSNDKHGHPEESVTLQKQKLLSSAASRYMELIDHNWEIRFDIISIIFRTNHDFSLEHYKDAFFMGL